MNDNQAERTKDERGDPDEPLEMNPWQANDPSGISGRPDAEPSPPYIRRLRWVVGVLAGVNFALRALTGNLFEESVANVLLFATPVFLLLLTTRDMIWRMSAIGYYSKSIGKRGYQIKYNKERGIYLIVALYSIVLPVLAQIIDRTVELDLLKIMILLLLFVGALGGYVVAERKCDSKAEEYERQRRN